MRAKIGQILGKMPEQNTKTEILSVQNFAMASYRSFPFPTPRRSFGGWKGLIDGEELKRNIYADRLINTMMPPKL